MLVLVNSLLQLQLNHFTDIVTLTEYTVTTSIDVADVFIMYIVSQKKTSRFVFVHIFAKC